ncbi:hypothetical protein METY_2135 [Methylopila sp. Yamaguchi]|nr:hypothetical protein METY_2135 [Methylopila sp. Yamaguchi]
MSVRLGMGQAFRVRGVRAWDGGPRVLGRVARGGDCVAERVQYTVPAGQGRRHVA